MCFGECVLRQQSRHTRTHSVCADELVLEQLALCSNTPVALWIVSGAQLKVRLYSVARWDDSLAIGIWLVGVANVLVDVVKIYIIVILPNRRPFTTSTRTWATWRTTWELYIASTYTVSDSPYTKCADIVFPRISVPYGPMFTYVPRYPCVGRFPRWTCHRVALVTRITIT